MGRAIVLPAPLDEPHRIVTWSADGELLDLLHREIGCASIDKSPQLHTRHGSMAMWVDDVGLLAPEVEHNDRAIGIGRAVGWPVADLARTVVITGGAAPGGDTMGLSDELMAVIERALAATREAA